MAKIQIMLPFRLFKKLFHYSGLHNFMVGPLRGDNFFYFTRKMEVMSIFNEAADFFSTFCV